MAGLISTPSIHASEADINFSSDGWFPAVNLRAVRSGRSFDGTVTTERLSRAVKYAIAQTNRQLNAWKEAKIAAIGASNMAAVPAPYVDNRSSALDAYQRAVESFAEADILESMRGYDLTAEGVRRAEMLSARIGEARRNAYWAINDILGETHTISGLV